MDAQVDMLIRSHRLGNLPIRPPIIPGDECHGQSEIFLCESVENFGGLEETVTLRQVRIVDNDIRSWRWVLLTGVGANARQEMVKLNELQDQIRFPAAARDGPGDVNDVSICTNI